LRIEADLDRCMGTANCMVVAPDWFELGEDDDQVRVLITSVPDDQRALAEDAVRRCPVGALRLV